MSIVAIPKRTKWSNIRQPSRVIGIPGHRQRVFVSRADYLVTDDVFIWRSPFREGNSETRAAENGMNSTLSSTRLEDTTTRRSDVNIDNRNVAVDNRINVDNRSVAVDNRSIINSINNSNNRSTNINFTVVNFGVLAGPIFGFPQQGNGFWPPHQPPPQNPPPARPAVPGNNNNRPPVPPAVPALNPLPAPILPPNNIPPPRPPAALPPPAQAPPRPVQLRVLHFSVGAMGEVRYRGEFPFLVRPGLTWMDLAMPCGQARGVPANQLAGGTWLFVHLHSQGLKSSQALDWHGPVNGFPCNAAELESLLFDIASFSPAVQKVLITR
ncbi:hypothetical protein FN846DRAFT_913885 [Sphaerosporella brunnea]|uniref:Uncharacterized protein n=1 Tax=Sphaerosporella brunnea TaxID=1250544 RepID=A0A5J5EE10_9PEZI|nr:hypothetical protein FN846DRAFT_913885 [Sphaerosporella brunnea]